MREAIRDAPAAKRILIANHPLSIAKTFNFPPTLAVEVFTVPMSDTVKEVVAGKVRRTVLRETLVQVVGPWIFDREALADALTRLGDEETETADMIGLCQAAHVRVRVLAAR
ncbi:MAG: hypothetical protein E6I37_08070 [Chloroflexi bacterium]|nr:MAG: hypothetical protein E6I37_08070 [Chloroflexota bacterium]